MGDLLVIPNCVAGEFKTTSETQILKDHFGNDRAIIHNATDADLRKAKRNIFEITEKLKKIPLQKIIRLVKESMKFYHEDEKDYPIIASLTGTPISFIRKSINELKEWASNIDEHILACFGQENYDLIPLKTSKGKTIGYQKYVPRGPVVCILPQNSEVVSTYVFIQILLSKSPGILKTSSSSAGPLNSIRYLEALYKAIDSLNDTDLEIIKKMFTVLGIFNTNKQGLVRKLQVDGASYVIFGSNETVEEVEKYLEGSKYQQVIKMGTGLSISGVFEDADILTTAKEISEAASENNGRSCTSTTGIYIDEKIYVPFLKALREETEKWKSDSPLNEKTPLGFIEEGIIEEIDRKLKEYKKNEHIDKSEKGLHLSVIEVEHHHPICEFSGPVLLVRKISDEKDFLEKLKSDLNNNSMERNLATAIFTRSRERFLDLAGEVPSYIVKHNKGTDKMNLLLEHQGGYLLKDFLRKITVETDSA